MKPSRCSTWGFSSLKRILITSQTWKLPIDIFVHWKVLQHSMRKFCNKFLQNLETRTLRWMCTTFLKSWNWFMHTMKPGPWGLHHVRGLSLPPAAPTRSSHYSSKAKVLHSSTTILPSCNYCGNLTHNVNECNIFSKDFFCDYCGKEGHHEAVCFAKFSERKQLWLP